jgi:hypothetical protein
VTVIKKLRHQKVAHITGADGNQDVLTQVCLIHLFGEVKSGDPGYSSGLAYKVWVTRYWTRPSASGASETETFSILR